MIRPVLKNLHSADVWDLESFQAGPEDAFYFGLQIFVGELDKEGADTFQLEVCSPKWLEQHMGAHSYRWGRRLLVMKGFSYDVLRNALDEIINLAVASTWEEVARRLERVIDWEFADPDTGELYA